MPIRTALCLSGQMRTFRACYDELKRHLLDPLQPDVFVHTWSRSGQTTEDNGSPASDEMIDSRLMDELYAPKACIVEEFKSTYFDALLDCRFPALLREKEPVHYKGDLPMFYKIRACNKLAQQYAQMRRQPYDLVIRLRPDMRLSEPIPDHVLEPTDVLWHSSCLLNPSFQVSDKFSVAPPSQMNY